MLLDSSAAGLCYFVIIIISFFNVMKIKFEKYRHSALLYKRKRNIRWWAVL